MTTIVDLDRFVHKIDRNQRRASERPRRGVCLSGSQTVEETDIALLPKSRRGGHTARTPSRAWLISWKDTPAGSTPVEPGTGSDSRLTSIDDDRSFVYIINSPGQGHGLTSRKEIQCSFIRQTCGRRNGSVSP